MWPRAPDQVRKSYCVCACGFFVVINLEVCILALCLDKAEVYPIGAHAGHLTGCWRAEGSIVDWSWYSYTWQHLEVPSAPQSHFRVREVSCVTVKNHKPVAELYDLQQMRRLLSATLSSIIRYKHKEKKTSTAIGYNTDQQRERNDHPGKTQDTGRRRCGRRHCDDTLHSGRPKWR